MLLRPQRDYDEILWISASFLYGHSKSGMGGRAQSTHADPFAAQVLKRLQLGLRDDVVDHPVGDDPHRARRTPRQGRAHRTRPHAGDILQLPRIERHR